MRSFGRIAIISVIVFIASLFLIASVTSGPPKESRIVRDFGVHRAAYERVRTMLSEDQGVATVADWGIENTNSPIPRIPPDGGMPVARYRQYLALLKQVGASRVDQGPEPREVGFGVWASGWGGDTRHVEVCWLEREPLNTVVSLDIFYASAKPSKPSYVHIDDHWYIWADW